MLATLNAALAFPVTVVIVLAAIHAFRFLAALLGDDEWTRAVAEEARKRAALAGER